MTLQTLQSAVEAYVYANPDGHQEASAMIARYMPASVPTPARKAPKARTPKGLDTTPQDTSAMSDAQMRAYYKARQYYDDARFLAQYSTVPSVKAKAAVLAGQIAAGTLPKPEHAGAVAQLRAQARKLWLEYDSMIAEGNPREEHDTDRVMVWRDGDGGGHTVQSIRREESAAFRKAGWRFYGEGQ